MLASPPTAGSLSDTHAEHDTKITREVVLATALELIDRDGVDTMSMRRLARAQP